MKYMDLWEPCDNMLTRFSSWHISDLRVIYVNDMVLSGHNTLETVKELVRDYHTVVCVLLFSVGVNFLYVSKYILFFHYLIFRLKHGRQQASNVLHHLRIEARACIFVFILRRVIYCVLM